jgi:hypothetical protein
MKDLKNFLSGRKTFLVGGLMILLGILQGDEQMILTGAGMITLRLGIANQ